MVLAVGAGVAGVRLELVAQLLDLAVDGGVGACPFLGRRLPGGGGARSWVRERSAEARSRRICGLRPLNDFGTFTVATDATGTGKSIIASRRACRSAVTT